MALHHLVCNYKFTWSCLLKSDQSVRQNREKSENLSLNRKKKVTFHLNVNTYFEASRTVVPVLDTDGDIERDGGQKSEKLKQSPLKDGYSKLSFPENHRYQNSVVSDGEEEEEEDYVDVEEEDFEEASDLDVYDDMEEEGKFEIVSDLKTELEISSRTINDATGSTRDRSQYIHAVLNPVENLTQWKTVKAKPSAVLKPRKENINLEEEGLDFIPFPSEEPTVKASRPKETVNLEERMSAKPVVAVDASLSNWLAPSLPASSQHFKTSATTSP